MDDSTPEVIVSFTTIPSRSRSVLDVMNGVMSQSVLPNAVCVSVPRYSVRERVEYPMEDIRRAVRTMNDTVNGRVEFRLCVLANDYGPLCKLMGPLLCGGHPDDIIITIDDDHEYSKYLVETLLKGSLDLPGAVALGGVQLGHGIPLGFKHPWVQHRSMGVLSAKFGEPMDTVMGVCGVLYRRGFFPDVPDPALEDLRKKHPLLHRHDDLYISAWLCGNGVDIRGIPHQDAAQAVTKTSIADIKPLCRTTTNDEAPMTGLPVMARHLKEWMHVVKLLRKEGFLGASTKNASIDKAFIFVMMGAFLILKSGLESNC